MANSTNSNNTNITNSASGSGQFSNYTNVMTSTLTSATWTRVPYLSVTVTPTNSSDKVLISGTLDVTGSSGMPLMWRLYVNGSPITALMGAVSGSGQQCTGVVVESGISGTDNGNISFSLVHSPASTSDQVYTIWIYTGVSSPSYFINRSSGDTNATSSAVVISTLSAKQLEITSTVAGTQGSHIPKSSIVQVVSTTTTAASSTSSTVAGTFYTSGTSVTITPTSSSNRIWLTGTCNASVDSATVHPVAIFAALNNGSSYINVGASVGSRMQVTSIRGGGNANSPNDMFTIPLDYIDSPATTSPITYTIWYAKSAGGNIYLNQAPNTTSAGSPLGITQLTAIEISK